MIFHVQVWWQGSQWSWMSRVFVVVPAICLAGSWSRGEFRERYVEGENVGRCPSRTWSLVDLYLPFDLSSTLLAPCVMQAITNVWVWEKGAFKPRQDSPCESRAELSWLRHTRRLFEWSLYLTSDRFQQVIFGIECSYRVSSTYLSIRSCLH